MTLQVTRSNYFFHTLLNPVELAVTVHDDSPDNFIQLQPYSVGFQLNAALLARFGHPLKFARKIFPPFVTLVGQKLDEKFVYLSMNVNLTSDVNLNIFAVDESGGSGEPGTGEQAHVAGVVQIEGIPASRDIVIISDDPSGREVLGEGTSASDGTFDIAYSDWGGPVIAIALDRYGQAFEPAALLNIGTVVHPTTPNGYVFVVTDAGATGMTEPAWSSTSNVVSGSVTFAPRPYYRPIASGPLDGEPLP